MSRRAPFPFALGLVRLLSAVALAATVPSAVGSFGRAAEFAGAHNTGVNPTLTLQKTAGVEISDQGVTIEGVDFTGMVSIVAPNVTLRNVRISSAAWAALNIRADHVTVEHCEIDGNNAQGIRGISINANYVSISHCNIHNVEDGIYLAESSHVSIKNNYIHTLRSDWNGPHYDGIATDGGVTDVDIQDNNIENNNNQTSAIMISNYFGGAKNIDVSNNRLAGGGYTIYVDGQFSDKKLDSVRIRDNRMVKGFYGFSSIVNNRPEWRGNVDDLTGEKI